MKTQIIPKLYIIRGLTDVAKENNFVAVGIFSFLFKFMALDLNLSYINAAHLCNDLRKDFDLIKPHLPSTLEEDINEYLDEYQQIYQQGEADVM